MTSLGENLVKYFIAVLGSNLMAFSVGESVLRRVWCELCKAVGWMHGVGLVHRDIKLESKVYYSDR